MHAPRSRISINSFEQWRSSLEDRADAVFGLARAATDGSAGPRPGAAPGIVANNRDGGIAIFEGYRGTPADIPGPRQSSGGDTRRAGGAGSWVRCTPTAPADTSRAGRIVHSSGIAVQPYPRLSHLSKMRWRFRNCCRVLPHPGRWLASFTARIS
jgi:hypothetical protein